MASNVDDAGGKLDEIQALLGQKNPNSPRPYLAGAGRDPVLVVSVTVQSHGLELVFAQALSCAKPPQCL
jgi:hypothetical protein